MDRIRRFLPAGVIVALASCAPSIRSARDESIPIPQGASWAWAARDTLARADRRSPVGEIVEQRFRRAMAAAMQEKGFRQVGDAAQADFELSAEFGEPRGVPVRRSGAVVVGVSTGWYGGWGRGRFGYIGPWGPWGLGGPWGFYQPWGWGVYGPMWAGYAAPAYVPGRRVYSDRALVVVLRDRPSGQVAWSARLGSDGLSSDMTQAKVDEVTARLFKNLP